MPTYVYECKTCQESFEVEQRITEAPLTDCECGGTVRRVIQPVGIAFKGSGFYVNDSAAKPASSDGVKKDDAKPAETKAPEGHAPTPAAATSESKPAE